MAAIEFDWVRDSLSEGDKALIDAYVSIGKPLDRLAYTDDFERLVERANIPDPTTDDAKRKAFQRLLYLRKRGRLPQIVPVPSED